MSYQVGKYCYADEASAALAACGQFVPVTAVLPGGDVRTVFCSSAGDHAWKLGVVTTNIGSGRSVSAEVVQPISFPACSQDDLLQSWEVIAGALLGVWAICYGIWKVRSLLTMNPRTGE